MYVCMLVLSTNSFCDGMNIISLSLDYSNAMSEPHVLYKVQCIRNMNFWLSSLVLANIILHCISDMKSVKAFNLQIIVYIKN